MDVGTSPSYPNWTYTNLSIAPHPAEGNYRVRIRKTGDEVTLSCMTNYSGQPFVADELRQMVDFGFKVNDSPRSKKTTEASDKKAA